MPISNLFKKDIQREINGVIKAGAKDREVIQNEIEEYVITREISRNMQKLFSNYVESFNNKTENIGVWISGFFGSGKSHLLKMVGNIIENGEFGGKSVSNYFEEKIDDDKILLGNIQKSSDVQTDVILFDIGKVSNHDGISSKNSIVVALLRKFNEHLGFFKDDLKLASFERFLWREEKYEDYKNIYSEITGNSWEEDRKNFDFRQGKFIQTIEKMDLNGFDVDAAKRWLEDEKEQFISAESFSELLKEYLERSGNNRRIIFLIDEIGQFMGDNSNLILNLQAIVEELGKELRGKVWIMVTAQQGIKDIIDQKTVKMQDFSKIQDRFKTRLALSSSNVDEVIKRRLLLKKEDAKKSLMSYFDDKRVEIANLITFEKNDFKLHLYQDAEEFADTYPFVPYQFILLQKVFEKIRKMSHSGQYQSKGERSLLDAFHYAGNNILNKEIGALVPFHEFYNSMDHFLDDTIRRPIIQASEQYRMEEFDVNLLKLLFLLKGIEEIKTNIDNLTSFMITDVKEDRITVGKRIEKALRNLEKQHLIQRNGEEYFFLTDDEQDINREIKDVPLDNVELLRMINTIIFQDILNTNKILVKETGNSYDFVKKIDGQPFSQQNSKLICYLITPYHDYYTDDGRLMWETSLRESSTLFVKLENIDDYMEEIREYIQIDKYVSEKMSKNPVDSIMRILQLKQSEKRTRYARIKDYLTKSIEGANFFLNGGKIEISSKNPKERLIRGFEKYAASIFRNAVLIKKHYSEAIIKDLLSYDCSSVGLFDIDNEISKNPNNEAIKEVESYMKDLHDRHDIINMKKIVDRFSNAPFGWSVLDIQGLITELFILFKIFIKYESEDIEVNSNNAANILTKVKSSNQEKIIIKPKPGRPVEKIKKSINLLKKIYGVGTNIEEARFEKEAKTLISSKKNLANVLIRREYGKNSRYEYPGKSDMEEYVDILEEILDKSSTEEELCDNIIDSYEDLEEIKDSVEIVTDFFDSNKQNKELFDMGVKKLEELSNNISYGELISCDDAKAIDRILTLKQPYHDLYKVTDHISNINAQIEEIINAEKVALKEQIEEKKDEFKNSIDDEKIIDIANKKYSDMENLIEKISDTNIFQISGQLNKIEQQLRQDYITQAKTKIKTYENDVSYVLKEKENVDDLIKEVAETFNNSVRKIENTTDFNLINSEIKSAEEEKENWINVANGKAKKREKVLIKRKPIEARSIETKEQVELYIEKVERETRELKENLLKAIENNKRVDIV